MKIDLGSLSRLGKGYLRGVVQSAIFEAAESVKSDFDGLNVPPSVVADTLAARIWRKVDKAL